MKSSGTYLGVRIPERDANLTSRQNPQKIFNQRLPEGDLDVGRMKEKSRFSETVLAALRAAKIIGLRAGKQSHRFIGVWLVVVKDRVFVRTWDNKPQGWYQTLLKEPEGRIQLGQRELRVRARKARGERLMDSVDLAYKEKYPTPGSRKYVEGFAQPERRANTIELLPW